MKTQTEDNKPVTESGLKKILQEYPNKIELKSELDDRFSKFYKAFSAEIDHKLLLIEERFDMKLTKFTARILTAIDPLLQELETRQRDREIGTIQLADHERRITTLERKRGRT